MMSAMSGMRRPNLSPRRPKMNAPTGRIISVSVIANATLGMVCPKSWPIGTRTNVTRKKSSASSAQPRKHAMKVWRCSRSRAVKIRSVTIGITERSLPRQASKQKGAEDDEEDVRHPDQKFGMNFWISAERVGDDDEKKVSDGDNESHCESDRSLATMRGDAKRHADDRERDAGERK